MAIAGCAAPAAIHPASVVHEVAERYDAFFPTEREVGLLRPRFGLPAIVQRGAPVAIEVLVRGSDRASAPSTLRAALITPAISDADAARCLRGETIEGCEQLSLSIARRESATNTVEHVVLDARATSTRAGGYDLVLASPTETLVRAPHAVWLSDGDPAAPRPLRVVQLSDLHVGADPTRSLPKLRRVLDAVAAIAPDLVLVTGDLGDDGARAALEVRARDLLAPLDAPVLVIDGGHDIGLGTRVRRTRRYGAGWEHFAQVFHPFLFYTLTVGGWDFIAFDTGPSAFFLGAFDRGIAPDGVALLRVSLHEALDRGRRGAILFSHAPTRSTFHNYGDERGRGSFGHMMFGGEALERALLDAAASGQRVLHLAGHTHWADAFEARLDGGRPHFARWPVTAISPCPSPISSPVALITTQSASRIGAPLKRTATGFGFTELTLDEGAPTVAFHHFAGDGTEAVCAADHGLASHAAR
jgi:hypothetical protein